MKHFSLLTFAALMATAFSASPRTLFYTDFGLRLPAAVTVRDMDGNSPSPEMQNLGFTGSDGWIWQCSDEELNGYACSTSWYEPAGSAEDWLLLPPLTLDCVAPVLQWRARAADRDLRDGYAVYVAEGSVSDPQAMKNATLLCRVDAENFDWTWRETSLDAYKGKEVTVAFMNDSRDCSRLCLDDVYVGSASCLQLFLDSSPIVRFESGIPLTGIVRNTGAEMLPGFTVSYEGAGGTLSRRFDTALAPGEEARFSLETQVPFDENDECRFSLTVAEGADTRSYPMDARKYNTSVYVEEGTGMWCGWCVRGIVYMDRMEAKYPDNFVGVVVHRKDEMECAGLLEGIASDFDFSTFPRCVVNRNKSIDPEDLPTEVEKARRRFSEPTAVKLQALLCGDDMTVKAGVRFARLVSNDSRYRLALVLFEDSVHNPAYYQNNSYAGSGEDMDGWEKKNSLILGTEMWFRNVSRALITDFEGDASLLPETVEPEALYEKEYTFTLPREFAEKKVVRENLYVAAVLLDTEQGMAVNAARTRVTDASGVEEITGVPAAEGCCYDLTGRRVERPGRGVFICVDADGKVSKVVL